MKPFCHLEPVTMPTPARIYHFKLTHDNGETRTRVIASNEESAIKALMDHEKCPRRAITCLGYATMNPPIPPAISAYMASLGRKGGKANGPRKARPSDQMRAVSRAYWDKVKASKLAAASNPQTPKI